MWTTAAGLLLLGAACSSEDPSPCGDGGREFGSDVGAVCAYAVVEGGFTCPTDLPEEFELPGGGRICAPSGAGPGDLPPDACRHLGHDDCSEAMPFDPGGGGNDGGMTALPDAGFPADAGGPRECDMLEATTWSGATPWGAVDAEVTHFNAGDCITISGAGLELLTAGGDRLWVGFSYPVGGGDGGRAVEEGTFDREANVTWQPATGSEETDTAMIRVAVTLWREHPDDPAGHEIDITVTFVDARFGTDPIVVRGRFCDWANLLC